MSVLREFKENGYPLDARKVLLDGFRQDASRCPTARLEREPS